LEEDEIDKERGVILSEKMSRDSVSYRLMEKQFAEILPGSLITERFPIGTEDVIKAAPRDRFVDLYTRFYTPARMTFIVVGDIDAKEMQAKIETTFGSMTNPSTPGPDPDLGAIKQPEGIKAAVFADKEVSSTDVSLTMIRPYVEKPDTAAVRAERMMLDIAHSIISRRFERLSKVEGSAIGSGSASDTVLFNYAELGSIDITAANDRWQEVVPILEQEFRRALEHGFTEAELAEVKSNLLNAYEQQVKQKPTRKSEGIATVLARSINDNSVFSDPVTNLELAKRALDGIDASECHRALKTFWQAPEVSGYHLVLTTKEKPEGAETELAALFEESRGKPVEAPAAREVVPFGYTGFGKPGTVTSRKDVKDMPMLDSFANAVFEGGGLGKHSNDELQQILAGKNVSSSLAIGEDAFTIGGSTVPADFTLQVQLMCATLTDPGYRNEGLWQFQKAIPEIYQQLKYTPAGPHQEMQAWLFGGDSRFAVAPEAKLASYTINDAKKWITPELAKGYMELSIVGDFEIDKILPDLLATFGALPARAAAPAALADARKVQFPNAPGIKNFTYESKVPQGIATTIWKTAGIRGNQKEFRRLNILGEI
ncbi:MAG: insulinase family protein, partial [Verrucomicrobiaceae bacterium]